MRVDRFCTLKWNLELECVITVIVSVNITIFKDAVVPGFVSLKNTARTKYTRQK